MTRFHNTLFVTQAKSCLRKEGETLHLLREGAAKVQVPLHHLRSVVCFGRVRVTPGAMHACAQAGVTLTFLSPGQGRFLARVEGPTPRTATLRRAQYAACNDGARALQLARSFVLGKIANKRTLVMRAARTRPQGRDALKRLAARLQALGDRCCEAPALDVLRGVEGEAASRYFAAFDKLVGPSAFTFDGRTRRPPRNPLNALLSFGYALLSGDCIAALEAAGLDPAVGLLHCERSGRPALALDLMEEFRAPLVDRLVLALIRRKQVQVKDFETQPSGAVYLKDDKRRWFIAEYQRQKQEERQHPSVQQRVPWALIPHLQAVSLARTLRGEGDYLPFLAR
ncbi:MAG: type I-C CRISPR-associated endonuclease Cas1c [Polyangiales bacterium]